MSERLTQFDRLPPSDMEAEACAVASMMVAVDPGEFLRIAALVDRQDFYSTDNQMFFDVMCSMRNAGKPVDAVLLRNELEQRGILNEVGGADEIGRMLQLVPSAAHGEHYAKIVKELSIKRQCITVANKILHQAYEVKGEDGPSIASSGVRELSELAARGSINRIYRLGEVNEDVIARIEAGEMPRIRTGVSELDKCIGGLPVGQFTMVGARPSVGKSLVIKQILRNVAIGGTPVGLITIEESRFKVAQNCLSAASQVENNKIAFHTICQEEWPSVIKGQADLYEVPFFMADYPVALGEVEIAIARMVAEHKCKVIAIDYIQLVDSQQENENREITLVSRAIKTAFKRLNVAGLVAVQLNRGNEHGETRWPVLKDLRGSGSLEQDGDVIILLHSDDYYRRQKGESERDGKLMLLVRKNKDGPQADIPVYLQERTQEIKDWT